MGDSKPTGLNWNAKKKKEETVSVKIEEGVKPPSSSSSSSSSSSTPPHAPPPSSSSSSSSSTPPHAPPPPSSTPSPAQNKPNVFEPIRKPTQVKPEEGSTTTPGKMETKNPFFEGFAIHKVIMSKMEQETPLQALFNLMSTSKRKIPRGAGGFYTLWNPKTMAKEGDQAIMFSETLFRDKPWNKRSSEYSQWLLKWLAPTGQLMIQKSFSYVSQRKPRIALAQVLTDSDMFLYFTIIVHFWVNRMGSSDRQMGRAQILREQEAEYRSALKFFAQVR